MEALRQSIGGLFRALAATTLHRTRHGDTAGQSILEDAAAPGKNEARNCLALLSLSSLGDDELLNGPEELVPCLRHETALRLRSSHGVGEYLSALHATRRHDECVRLQWYPLSEFVFFLRFMVPEHPVAEFSFEPSAAHYFAIPDGITSSADVFAMFEEHVVAMGTADIDVALEAWKLLMGSRLTDMTACAHLSDMFTWKVFFESRNAAEQNSGSVEANSLPVGAGKLQALNRIVESHRAQSHLVRIETSGHSYVFDIPARSDPADPARIFHIESVLNCSDARARPLDVSNLFDALIDVIDYIDKLVLYCYDEGAAKDRLAMLTVQCFRHDLLDRPMTVARGVSEGPLEGSGAFTWGDALDFVDRMNACRRWGDAAKYILPPSQRRT